jgi:hypothetical protein
MLKKMKIDIVKWENRYEILRMSYLFEENTKKYQS